MSRKTSFTWLAVLLVMVGSVVAQEIEVPALPRGVPPAPEAREGTLSLALPDAYALALTRNLDLQVGRFDLAAAQAGILQSIGIFDPKLDFGVNGDYTKSPAATQLAGAQITESRNTGFSLGLSQLLPSGTTYSVSTRFNRSETNSTFFFLNPRWSSDVTLQVTQPLLNGFGTTVNRSGLVIARNSREQTAVGLALSVIGTVQQVENAYWDLVAARKAVEVKEQSLKLARRLLEETKERVRVGTSAPIDLVQSEAAVAARRQELITARNAAADAEDALKSVLGFDQPREWTVHIETREALEVEPLQVDLDTAIRTALDRRPEIHRQMLAIEALRLNVDVARNATLPRLDLSGSYGFAGLGGQLTVRDPQTGAILDTIPGGFDDAVRQLRDLDFPHWTVGVTFSLPLGNNDARARLAQRRYELEKGLVELQALKQQVILEVRRAVRGLEDGAASIDAAVASTRLAEKNLEAEHTKFANGLSTNYQVLQIQDDLAQAQLTELNARVAYRKALVAYQVATGTLLEKDRIRIADPGSPEVPHDFWGNVTWLQMTDLKGAAGPSGEAPGDAGKED